MIEAQLFSRGMRLSQFFRRQSMRHFTGIPDFDTVCKMEVRTYLPYPMLVVFVERLDGECVMVDV